MNDEEYSADVLVIRSECSQCHDMIETMNAVSDSIDYEVYVIESNEMTVDEKQEFIRLFDVSTVPVFLIFKQGKLNTVEMGVPTEERFLEIIGG